MTARTGQAPQAVLQPATVDQSIHSRGLKCGAVAQFTLVQVWLLHTRPPSAQPCSCNESPPDQVRLPE